MGGTSLINTINDQGHLRDEELAPAVAVVMFGAIETSEGMTANVLWHLMNRPALLDRVCKDRSLVAAAIEESLRLEPAAAVIDRYTTADVSIGEVVIPADELVTLSLLSANRDPLVFPEPDDFDLSRSNLRAHITFVQGPHACIGVHLARAETVAAVNAVLDMCPHLEMNTASTTAPAGLIFRKPAMVTGRWEAR